MEWSKLHDATLVKIAVDWSQGEVIITLRQYSNFEPGTGEIIIRGVQELRMPRRYPWGESVSINDVQERMGDNCRILDVEMQSGDVITIVSEIIEYNWRSSQQ